VLPHGTGKTVRVAVFTQGKNADLAREAGADIVGMEDLAEKVKAGELNFDVVVASPDAMRVVGQLGQILGPRGLMPNPKVGTVTPDVAGAVRNAKAGQVRFRTDKGGVIHCTIGKASFDTSKLKENLQALLGDLQKLCASSGVGAQLDLESLPVSKELARRHAAGECERLVLFGGDDYELLFTVPAGRAAAIEAELSTRHALRRIGRIEAAPGVRCARGGRPTEVHGGGYDHFA